MSRKNEGVLDLLILLPWWVSIISSAVVYVGLKYIAPAIFVDNLFLQPMLKALPNIALLVAIVLLVPAPISAFNSRRKRKLLDEQDGIQSIRDLSWREFEELVGEVYRRQGYIVIENQTGGADGGIDLRLKKEGHTHLVQCKNWRNTKVGVKVVREMYGVMIAEKAFSTIIVISGIFTQEAKNFATGKPIELVDGLQLEPLISSVQSSTERIAPTIRMDNQIEVIKDHKCPNCGSLLVVRSARKGANVGNRFYGCSTFPKCRYTENLDMNIL